VERCVPETVGGAHLTSRPTYYCGSPLTDRRWSDSHNGSVMRILWAVPMAATASLRGAVVHVLLTSPVLETAVPYLLLPPLPHGRDPADLAPS
jgi:hypothetical protein